MYQKKFKYIACFFALAVTMLIFAFSAAADQTPDVPIGQAKVVSIEVQDMPIKTQYLVGEKLDMSGATLKLTYDNGNTGSDVVKLDWCTGFDSSKTGVQNITVKYGDTDCTAVIQVEVIKEVELKIVKPQKLVYFVGEKQDLSGLSVSVIYNNGGSKQLGSEDYAVTGFTSNTIGEKTVTVKYKELTATYTVTVIEAALIEIRIEKEPNKLTYYTGEELDLYGIKVVAYYQDGKSADISSKITVSGNANTAGEQTITVSYSERDYKKSATFEITVIDVEIKSIQFQSRPTKLVYYENEIFDPAGTAITVTYNNGTSETVTDGMTFKGFKSDTIGVKTITLHYRGHQLEFEIEVVVSPTHVHTEGPFTVTKAPTCTELGEQITVCTVCGEVVNRVSIPATGHGDESDPVTIKAPTCTEPGEMATKCMVCGETVSVSEIAPLGHTEGEPHVTKSPTCTEHGETVTKCTVCGETVSVTQIEPLGHSFGEWIRVLDPTGESEGSEERTCSVCAHTEVRSLPKLVNALASGDISVVLNPPGTYFPYGTVFTGTKVTDTLTPEELAALIPGGEYAVIDVFDLVFTDINGAPFVPVGEMCYSVNYTLPVNEYSSFLIYDTDLGRYTPVTDASSFGFTVERSGRFILVGEQIPETTNGTIGSDTGLGTDSADISAGSNTGGTELMSGNTAVILVLLITAGILIVIIAALVYTYAIKQD
ncbi:MAG: bacterial Ig-like domain-containing protein [Eubacteriales bacterium]